MATTQPSSKHPDRPARPAYFKDLLLLFAVPAGITFILALVVYVPRLLAHPRYDFIYSSCDTYSCSDSYHVQSGQLVQTNANDNTSDFGDERETELYYYDVSEASARRLTYAEASALRLDGSSKSPDGYTLTSGTQGGGFLFWDNYDYRWYLADGLKKKPIDFGQLGGGDYASDPEFLGWVASKD